MCGKQFSWAAEKESLQRSASFLAMYPKDTSETSALVSSLLLMSSECGVVYTMIV